MTWHPEDEGGRIVNFSTHEFRDPVSRGYQDLLDQAVIINKAEPGTIPQEKMRKAWDDWHAFISTMDTHARVLDRIERQRAKGHDE